MKERPILFSAPMVRAILEGRKTQTRRVVKPSVKGCTVGAYICENSVEPVNVQEDGDPWEDIPCPYGQPGDQLWVRETFQPLFEDGWEEGMNPDGSGDHANWKTGEGYSPTYPATDGIFEYSTPDGELSAKCWPSIHMPRWASRIQLEITGIRVERLQDCSVSDAIAEGYDGSVSDPIDPALKWYSTLWESINGAGSWDANPWVWVVEFKVIKP